MHRTLPSIEIMVFRIAKEVSETSQVYLRTAWMKGIDDDYKLSELLSGRRSSDDVAINVAVVKFRFSGAVVLTKKINVR